jgi:hypothetical protein
MRIVETLELTSDSLRKSMRIEADRINATDLKFSTTDYENGFQYEYTFKLVKRKIKNPIQSHTVACLAPK